MIPHPKPRVARGKRRAERWRRQATNTRESTTTAATATTAQTTATATATTTATTGSDQNTDTTTETSSTVKVTSSSSPTSSSSSPSSSSSNTSSTTLSSSTRATTSIPIPTSTIPLISSEVSTEALYLTTFASDFPVVTATSKLSSAPGRGYVFVPNAELADSMLLFATFCGSFFVVTILLVRCNRLWERHRGVVKQDQMVSEDMRWAEGSQLYAERRIVWDGPDYSSGRPHGKSRLR